MSLTIAYLSLSLLGYSAYCKGEAKATNAVRELMTSLRKGAVPAVWRAQYATRPGQSLGEWFADLVSRTRVLSSKYAPTPGGSLLSGAELMRSVFWVGGMFTPEAFVTATRQQTAQVSGNSDGQSADGAGVCEHCSRLSRAVTLSTQVTVTL